MLNTLMGREIYHVRMVLRNKDTMEIEYGRLRRLRSMIQVKFKASLDTRSLEKDLRKKEFKLKTEDKVLGVLKVLDTISQPDRLWIEGLFIENTSLYNLEQKAVIKLFLEEDRVWWLKSEPIGQLIITPTVLALAKELLNYLNPEEVLYTNLGKEVTI